MEICDISSSKALNEPSKALNEPSKALNEPTKALNTYVCCEVCGKSFSKRSNMLRHQRSISCSRPSLPNNNPPLSDTINISCDYTCKYCDTQFKHKSSLCRHEGKCKNRNNDDDMHKLVELLNNQLEQQRNENIKQSNQIEALIKKVGITTTNNNITVTNNTLLSHRDTSTNHLTNTDWKICIERCLRCIPQLIEIIHFDPKTPNNHNIYISNIKNNYAMLYNGEKWILADRDSVINNLIDDKEQMVVEKLEEWEEIGSINYPKAMERFNRYLNLKENDQHLNMMKNEIKLLLFNNRDMVSSKGMNTQDLVAY